jgi:DNA-binding XRE family transcriptional regulator
MFYKISADCAFFSSQRGREKAAVAHRCFLVAGQGCSGFSGGRPGPIARPDPLCRKQEVRGRWRAGPFRRPASPSEPCSEATVLRFAPLETSGHPLYRKMAHFFAGMRHGVCRSVSVPEGKQEAGTTEARQTPPVRAMRNRRKGLSHRRKGPRAGAPSQVLSSRRTRRTKEAREFGRRVRRLREKKGLTQTELAETCGLRKVQIGDIERGEANIRLSTLLRITRGLETTIERMLEAIL